MVLFLACLWIQFPPLASPFINREIYSFIGKAECLFLRNEISSHPQRIRLGAFQYLLQAAKGCEKANFP